jgi:pimeloyl-ACP methyl ester carboxylesterase
MAQRARAVTDCDATHELLQVNVPILYLQATEDRVVGKEALLEIKRLRPETTSTALRGPHMLLQREPLLAAEEISEFIKTHRLLRGL